MTTILIIIVAIIVFMILFSVIDKGERENIKKAIEIRQSDLAQQQAEDIVKKIMTDSVNESGMDGLVRIIQMNYKMNGDQANVSHIGSELIINLLEPDLINLYYELRDILENSQNYSSYDFTKAQSILQMFKEAGIKSIQAQSSEERSLFKNAGVKTYTSQIDGNFIYSIDYY